MINIFHTICNISTAFLHRLLQQKPASQRATMHIEGTYEVFNITEDGQTAICRPMQNPRTFNPGVVSISASQISALAIGDILNIRIVIETDGH